MGKIIKRTFDVTVSLGSCCQTAYQLDKNGLRGPSYPFDWVVTPYKSLYEILKNNFKNWLTIDTLKCITGKHARDNVYGISLLHDFQYKRPEEFLSDYDAHFEKYQRRINRFRELLAGNQRVLFVRREIKQTESIQLRDLIRSCYPNLNFNILALDNTEEYDLTWNIPSVINRRLQPKVPYNWHGDDDQWRDVLLGLSVKRLFA
jgi:hypothetical protein